MLFNEDMQAIQSKPALCLISRTQGEGVAQESRPVAISTSPPPSPFAKTPFFSLYKG